MKQNICIRALADVEQINACREEVAGLGENIKNLSGILNLAGNEVRFKILFLLNKERELCVCDLSDILGMSVSAISQHLRKLKDGKMVDVRKEGQTYYYFVKNDRFSLLASLFDIVRSKTEMLKAEQL
ncbi:MAG: metalloregulator ArsR/SmtB family transcription factor [Bacteroidales bacterium]|nr:metalloregulator ArsR/SmtB family transcription factor [Bacteroidales bacterium]